MNDSSVIDTEIEYPSSDGQPISETGLHVHSILSLYATLREYFELDNRRDVYVAADMFWYSERGVPSSVICPDVMIIPDLKLTGIKELNSYLSWNHEVKKPAVVFEMASRNTWREDLGRKYKKYEALGVHEYFLFDPTGEFLLPRLQGYRLLQGRYERLLLEEDDTLDSDLGFRMKPDGILLRVLDGKTGQPVLSMRERYEHRLMQLIETEKRAEQEAQRANQEAQRSAKLEQELAQLRAQLQSKNPGGAE